MKIVTLPLLLIVLTLSCNQSTELPSASVKGVSQPEQKTGEAQLPNILWLPKPKTNTTKTGTMVFKSTDGGQSWLDISAGLPGKELQGSFFVNDGGLYLRSGNYIYHSKATNKAPFWEKENFPDDYSMIAPGKLGMFAYDYHQGKFRQKIKGKWSPVYQDLKLQGIIDVFETAGGSVFIVCDHGRGLFKSTDKGKNWKEVYRGAVKLTESNGVLMAITTTGIKRSTDDGETWEPVLGEDGVGFHLARIDGGFGAITSNRDSDIRRIRISYDGGKTWQAIDGDLPAGMRISSIIQVGSYFFCGHDNGIYRSEDKGKTWQLILPSIEGKVFNLSVSGNVIYAIPSAGC